MDKDELEEVENSELNDNQEEEQPSSEITESNNNEIQEEEPSASLQKVSSLISDLVMLWKRIPISAKGAIITCLGYVVIFIVAVLLIMLLGAAATGVAEDLFPDIANFSNTIANVGEKVGNFFTGEGFVTNQEEAEKYEKKYYEKLKQVSDYYRNKLGVQIDTTMITATLFYGRGMSDYVDDDINEYEDSLFLDEESDSDIYQGEADFYKLARRQIKTLAKFQIVEYTSFNTCPSNPEISSSKWKTVPTSAEDIADTWTGFNSWNTRSTFDYQPYEYKPFSKIDGSARSIKWCEFKSAKEQLANPYKEDYEIYKKYYDDYKSCLSSAKENCKSKCNSIPNSAATYDTCASSCQSKSFEEECSSKKELKDEYLTKLKDSWGDVYEIGDEPNGTEQFVCGNSSTWGNLTDYNNNFSEDPRSTDRNYIFPEDWYDREAEPGFWASTLSWFTGGYAPFGCSAKPSIQIQYNIDITDEGVYYHKLLSPHATFLGNKSFIEKYYPEYISDDPENAYDDAVEIVDGIFELYDFISDRERTAANYCLYNGQAGIGVGGTGIGTGTSYTSESASEFVSMIAPTVVQDMQNTGVPASVTIAQAILESTHGTSGLTRKYNNYYGETAGDCAKNVDKSIRGPIAPGTNNNTCSGNSYWDGTIVRMCNKSGADCQWYRVYNGFENSTADHSVQFLRTNFSYCDPLLSNPQQYVSCLVEKPNHKYATDPNYVQKVMSVINNYNLTQYDIGVPSSETLNTTPTLTLSNTACIPISSGTIMGTGAQGIRTSLSQAEREPYWGSSNTYYPRNEGQCTWYAFGRGLEILTKNGMTMEEAIRKLDATHGHAYDWYANNKYFSSSPDINQPKVGAIIVWGNKISGHVAVVEEIKYDASGKIEGVYCSEGNTSTKKQGVYGGFKYSYKTLEQLSSITGGGGRYRFIGYIYLIN